MFEDRVPGASDPAGFCKGRSHRLFSGPFTSLPVTISAEWPVPSGVADAYFGVLSDLTAENLLRGDGGIRVEKLGATSVGTAQMTDAQGFAPGEEDVDCSTSPEARRDHLP